MIFLISAVIALIFILFCDKAVRRHPVPFYIGTTVISILTVTLTWLNAEMPFVIYTYIWPIFSRGGLAGAFFIIIMLTGAFPNGSAPIKRLMPIRGQLSVIASILTIVHNTAYGKTYFVKLFTDSGSLPVFQRIAAICSVLMILIMLPLFITSFLFR